MKTSDIDTRTILEYLYPLQGSWTCLWYGQFKNSDPTENDVYYAMPEGTPPKIALSKMRNLYKKGYVGGCGCGCRGDFEITDKGLAFLGKPRLKPYNGY